MSSPFLHKTISFSESCVGDLMLYVATKFNNKMYQMLVWPFLAFANIKAPFSKKCWGDDIAPLSGNVVIPLYSSCIWRHKAPRVSSVPSYGVFYVVIAGIKKMGKINIVQTLCSYSIPPPKSVVDPDLLNSDPDTESGSCISSESGSMWRVFLAVNVGTLVILWRVIPSPLPMDMKQYRYLNFDKSNPLILNYQEKVLGYVPQKFWSFLKISAAFFGICQNKVVT